MREEREGGGKIVMSCQAGRVGHCNIRYISHQFPCFVKWYKVVRTDACRVMEGKRVNERGRR